MQVTVNKAAYFDRMRQIWIEETAGGKNQAALDRYHARQKEEWARAKGLAREAVQIAPGSPKATDPSPEPQPARKRPVVARLVRKAAPKVACPDKPLTVGELLKAIKLAGGAGKVRPILNTVLVTDGGAIRWTNLETTVTCYEPEIGDGRTVCIDLDWLRGLPPKTPLGAIQFEGAIEDRVVCTCGPFRSPVTLDPEEFPDTPVFGEFHPTGITPAMLGMVAYAASTDINKKILNGICIENTRVIGTDGHRLTFLQDKAITCTVFPDRMETHWFAPNGDERIRLDAHTRESDYTELKEGYTSKEVVVPGSVVIPAWIAKAKFEALAVSKTHCQFTVGALQFTCALVEGNYPQWRRVVPDGCRLKAVFSREALMAEVKNCMAMASDRYMGFKMEFESGECRISFNNPGVAEYANTIPCEWTGDPFHTSFNARYVREALERMTGRDVEIEFNESQSPAMMRESTDTATVTNIIMPMML